MTSATIHLGKIYMVEAINGETETLRILNETPTHYIFSSSSNDSVEVFERAKKDIRGIHEIKEWCKAHPEE
jgi:hypothetical protein